MAWRMSVRCSFVLGVSFLSGGFLGTLAAYGFSLSMSPAMISLMDATSWLIGL